MVDWCSMKGRLGPGFYQCDDIFEQPGYTRWAYEGPSNTKYQPAIEKAVAKWMETQFHDGMLFFDDEPLETDDKIVITEANYKKLI